MSKITTTLVSPFASKLTLTKLHLLTRGLVTVGEFVKVLAVSCGLLMFVQLVFPSQITRPFIAASYGRVGFKSRRAIENKLQQLNDTPIILQLENTSYTEKPSSIGMNIASEKTASQAVQYSLAERLTPFSLFARHEISLHKQIDDRKLDLFIQKAIAENKRPAKNAQLTQDAAGNYKVQGGETGAEYHPETLRKSLMELSYGESVSVAIKGSPVEPPISAGELQITIAKAEAVVRQGIMILIAGENHSISSNQLKGWIRVVLDETHGTTSLEYDRQAIAAWVQSKAAKYYLPATPTTTSVVDGKTVETRPGKEGRRVEVDQTVNAIVASLDKGAPLSNGVIKPVAPVNQVSRSYTATNHGLQLLIEDWQREQGKARVGVVFREMGGQGRQASVNAGQTFFAASFYKLYVAHYLLSRIMNGQLDPNAQLQGGRSIITCVEVMIVNSDSPCPEAAASVFGWNQIHAFAHAAGFGSTTLAAGNIRTSAADTADYMTCLYQGSLLGSYTGAMQGWMQRQIYRSAIPAGAKGSVVADKVGFYSGSWHDAAIVSGPKATYVLAVMTEGVGPASIATLTQRIQATFGQ